MRRHALTRAWLVVTTIVAGLLLPQAAAATPTEQARVTRVTASELAAGEVTDRATLDAILPEVAERYAQQHGLPVTASSLRLFAVPGGDGYVVADSLRDVRAVVDTVVTDRGDVRRTSSFEFRTAAGPRHFTERGAGTSGDVSVQGSWQWKAGTCFSRYEETGGWIDHCYKLYKYSDSIWTGSAWRDAFALFHYATAGPKTSWYLTKATLWSEKHTNSSSMEWADWNPRGSDTKNCQSYSISLSAGGVGISHTAQWCEKWTPTKYTTPGHFRNQWSGAISGSATREIAYGIEVYVPVGGWPQWWLYRDVDYVLNCC